MLWLKLALSTLLLAYLGWALDLSAIAERLAGVDWYWVALACMCLLIGQVFSAVRWAWLAEGLGLGVNILRKIQLYFLGMFLSLFLPSIIGGDVARGWMLARGRKSAGWPAAASVIMERISGVFGITLLVTGCLFFVTIPELFSTLWYTMVAGLWLLMLLTPKLWPRLQAMQVKRLAGWQQLPLLSPGFRSAWWRSLPVSVLFQALVIQAHVFLGLAAGLDLSWAAYGFIVCLVALASALPLSFNGFGIREGGYVGLAVWFGGNSDAAAAMAMLWVLVMLIVAAPGGLVLWRLGGTGALKKSPEE